MSSSIPADTAAASDKTELEKLREENQELKKEVNRNEANFKDFEEALSKRETELDDLRGKNSELTAEVDRLKKEGKVAEQTLQASQDNGAKKKKELVEAKRNFEETIKLRDQQLEEAKLELEESNRNNEKLRKDHEKQVFDQREELKKVHEELHHTKVILQDLEGPEGVHGQAVKQLFDTQIKLNIVTRDFQESEQIIDGLTLQINEYEKKYCKLTQEINEINAWVMDNRALLTRSEAIAPPPADNLEAELGGGLDYDSDSNYDSESGSLPMPESDERDDGGSSPRQEPEETVDGSSPTPAEPEELVDHGSPTSTEPEEPADRSSPTSTEPEEPADDDSSAIDESKEHIDHSSPPTSEFEPRINDAPHVTSPSFQSSDVAAEPDKDQQQIESSVTAADNENTHDGHKATDVTDVTTSETPSTERNTTSDEQQTASVETAGTVQNVAPIEQSTAPVETAGTVQNAATEQPTTSIKEAGTVQNTAPTEQTTTSVEEGRAVQNITSPSGTSVAEQNITSDEQPTTSSETSTTRTTAAETATADSTAAKQSATPTEGTTSAETTAGEQDTTSTEQPTTSTAPQPAVSEHMDAVTKQHVATSGPSHGGTAQAAIATDHVGTANDADVTTAPVDIHMEGKRPHGVVHHLLTKPQEHELSSPPKNKYEQAFKLVDPPDDQPDFRMNRWEEVCDGNVTLVRDVYGHIPDRVKLMWDKPAGDYIDPKAEVTIDSIKRYYPESGPFSALEAIQMFPAERKLRNELAQENRELQKELESTLQDKISLEDDVQDAERDTRLVEEKLAKALEEKKDLEEDKKELEEELHDTIVQLQFTEDDVQHLEREKEKSGLAGLEDKYKQMSGLYATAKQQLEALQATASTPPSANQESELCRLTTRNAQLEANLAELKTYIAERNAHNKLVQGPTVETAPALAPAPVVEPAPHAAEPAAPVVAQPQQQQQPCRRPHLFLWPFLIFVFVFVTFCRFAATAQRERDLWLDANDGARLETLRLVHAPLGSAAAALDHRTAMLTMYGEAHHEMLDLRPWWWTEGEQVRRGFWVVLRNLMGAR